MNPTVSIIVPVYNAEDTIERCVDSVIHQDYQDYELLLIDDGSSDSSGAICDRAAGDDQRVQVVHKANSGVSDSRNLGISLAKGTYLQFVDSDDWIPKNATSQLIQAANRENCDLVVAGFYRVVGERVSPKNDIDEECLLSREEYLAHMMEHPADFYYGVLWNKLYRREIVIRHNLKMNPKISWCEDFMFNLEYILWAASFYALSTPVYYYVKTKGSLASQSMSIAKTIRMKLTVFEYYNQFFKTVLDEDEYEKSRLKVYRFLIDAAGDGTVPFLTGSTKLGNEHISVAPQASEGDGLLLDFYLERKMADSLLETITLKYKTSLQENRILFYLCEAASWTGTRKEFADVLGISRSTLSRALQHLTSKEWISVENVLTESDKKSNGGQIHIVCTEQAGDIIDDLAGVRRDYTRAVTAGLDETERTSYQALTDKIRMNMRHALRNS